jgi:hypothetical protein
MASKFNPACDDCVLPLQPPDLASKGCFSAWNGAFPPENAAPFSFGGRPERRITPVLRSAASPPSAASKPKFLSVAKPQLAELLQDNAYRDELSQDTAVTEKMTGAEA